MRLIDADVLMLYLNDIYFRNSPNGNSWRETLEMKQYREGVCEGLEMAMKSVEEAPTVGGWISVKDRLPKKNQIVIASDGEHTWDVGMYRSLCGKPSEWNWKKNTVKTVLWWMPKDGALPEPPKEEQ